MLELRDVSKRYGSFAAVSSVNLRVDDGEFFCLLGPSGCGKTTLLRMIAGFEIPDSGTILLNGEDITRLPPYRRNVNTVFQNYALFPHYSVADNVAYGLRARKCPEDMVASRVTEALETVGLAGYEKRMPSNLSGGQQQRVALARALVNQPKLLLLDEPLSALDKKIGEQMRYELADLQARTGITFLFVTHNQTEAMAMASRIAVMNRGAIEQLAPPQELYQNPSTRFIADFVGSMNFFDGAMVDSDGDTARIRLPGETMVHHRGAHRHQPGEAVVFGVRPEQLRVSLLEPKDFENGINGRIVRQVFTGDATLLGILLADQSVVDVRVPNYLMLEGKVMALEPDEEVWVIWSRNSGVVLDA